MKEKSLKSYGEKTDKSMKTVMRLLRVAHILNNKTELFLSKHNLTFNQFKVLEVLYHKGDLNISSIQNLSWELLEIQLLLLKIYIEMD